MSEVIRTRLSKQQVEEILRSLPSVLTGKRRRAGDSLFRRTFWANFAKEFYRLVRKGALRKSYRTRDELGNVWKPIKKETIARKRKKHKRHGVWLPPSKFATSRNRDTSDLLDSLSPGTVADGVYQKVSNQLYKLSADKLELGSKVWYAEYASFDRPLFPDNREVWIDRATVYALKATIRLLSGRRR